MPVIRQQTVPLQGSVLGHKFPLAELLGPVIKQASDIAQGRLSRGSVYRRCNMADLPGGQTSAVQPTSPATANSSANGGSIRSQSNQVRVNAARVAYSRWKVLFFWAAFGINMLQVPGWVRPIFMWYSL